METIIIAILAVVVIAAVGVPLLRGGRGGHHDAREYAVNVEATTSPSGSSAAAPIRADPSTGPSYPPPTGRDEIEAEVARYRLAVAAGTVCRRCGEANTADAKFCADCGQRLPTASNDAQEFA